MKILYCTEHLSLVDQYNLTRSPETEKMSEHVGEELPIDKYMVREEERADTGEAVIISSIMSKGKVYATNSATFCREFTGILEMAKSAGEKVNTIRISEGKSNKGRTYITCVYVN